MSFKLADIFTSNMVLQRDEFIPIWGTGSNGTKLNVLFCDELVETTVENEKWFLTLSPKLAGGPYLLKIFNGSEVYVLENILIGDVFIAGGQSNMEFELQRTLNGEDEVKKANYPNIRYYQVPKMEFEDPNFPKSTWTVCSPENAGLYSAVAYHFAKNLDLNIPIGIIGCNWGGTSASCWMSREYLEKNEDLKIYIDEYDKEINKYTLEEHETRRLDFIKYQQEFWQKYVKFKAEHPEVPDSLVTTQIGDWPWPPPVGPKSFLRPAGVYYTMLKKISPYGIKAVLWYQGESDTNRPKLYEKLFTTMIINWREDFNNSNLPFLFVQLPGFGNWNPKGLDYAYLRESQFNVSNNVKNVYMVVSIDCGDIDDIHPINKEPIGYRLALLGKAKLYNREVNYSGPIFNALKIEDNKIILSFEHTYERLVIKGEIIKGFSIRGKDNKFLECIAYLSESSKEIILYHDDINNPIYVRYGFENYPEVNVYNNIGLPLCPFRTDKL